MMMVQKQLRRRLAHDLAHRAAQHRGNAPIQRHRKPCVGDAPGHPVAALRQQTAVARRDAAQHRAADAAARRLHDGRRRAVTEERGGNEVARIVVRPQVQRAQLQADDERHPVIAPPTAPQRRAQADHGAEAAHEPDHRAPHCRREPQGLDERNIQAGRREAGARHDDQVRDPVRLDAGVRQRPTAGARRQRRREPLVRLHAILCRQRHDLLERHHAVARSDPRASHDARPPGSRLTGQPPQVGEPGLDVVLVEHDRWQCEAQAGQARRGVVALGLVGRPTRLDADRGGCGGEPRHTSTASRTIQPPTGRTRRAISTAAAVALGRSRSQESSRQAR